MAGAALPVRPGGASAASGAALRLRRAARLRRRTPLQPLALPAGAPAPRELQPGPAADVLGAGPAAPVDERRPPRRADRRRGVPGRYRPRSAGPRPRAGRGGRRPARVRRLLTSAHRDELTRTADRALGPGRRLLRRLRQGTGRLRGAAAGGTRLVPRGGDRWRQVRGLSGLLATLAGAFAVSSACRIPRSGTSGRRPPPGSSWSRPEPRPTPDHRLHRRDDAPGLMPSGIVMGRAAPASTVPSAVFDDHPSAKGTPHAVPVSGHPRGTNPTGAAGQRGGSAVGPGGTGARVPGLRPTPGRPLRPAAV